MFWKIFSKLGFVAIMLGLLWIVSTDNPEAQHMLRRVGNVAYIDTLEGANARVTRDFYFNSGNSRTSPTKYDGYSSVKVKVDSLHATDSDSLTILLYKLDLDGVASEDSTVVVSLWDWTDGKIKWYRLDNLSGYTVHPGIRLVWKSENAAADTFSVTSEVWFH